MSKERFNKFSVPLCYGFEYTNNTSYNSNYFSVTNIDI